MATLPSISLVIDSTGRESLLSTALSILFEPSPILETKLVPSLAASLPPTLTTYTALVDLATSTIASWDTSSQASFIAAHPRIGEVTNLSQLSTQEQAAKATPPDVLESLAKLNARYEVRYPGLRYITFVNGRSRSEVRDEMERVLGEDSDAVYSATSPEWRAELDRAVQDVGRIAKSRVRNLGAE